MRLYCSKPMVKKPLSHPVVIRCRAQSHKQTNQHLASVRLAPRSSLLPSARLIDPASSSLTPLFLCPFLPPCYLFPLNPRFVPPVNRLGVAGAVNWLTLAFHSVTVQFPGSCCSYQVLLPRITPTLPSNISEVWPPHTSMSLCYL